MTKHDDCGMATAEYSVGTLGAVTIALVLLKLGLLDDHNPWMQAFESLIDRALGGWGILRDMMPRLGIRGG